MSIKILWIVACLLFVDSIAFNVQYDVICGTVGDCVLEADSYLLKLFDDNGFKKDVGQSKRTLYVERILDILTYIETRLSNPNEWKQQDFESKLQFFNILKHIHEIARPLYTIRFSQKSTLPYKYFKDILDDMLQCCASTSLKQTVTKKNIIDSVVLAREESKRLLELLNKPIVNSQPKK